MFDQKFGKHIPGYTGYLFKPTSIYLIKLCTG